MNEIERAVVFAVVLSIIAASLSLVNFVKLQGFNEYEEKCLEYAVLEGESDLGVREYTTFCTVEGLGKDSGYIRFLKDKGVG